jgi:hypothetical protein
MNYHDCNYTLFQFTVRQEAALPDTTAEFREVAITGERTVNFKV